MALGTGTGIPREGRGGAELRFRLAQVSYLAVRKCKIQFQMPSISLGFSVMQMRCFNITDKSQSILKQTGHCLCQNCLCKNYMSCNVIYCLIALCVLESGLHCVVAVLTF